MKLIISAFICGCLLAYQRAAHAQLLGNLNFNQRVDASHSAPPLTDQHQEVAATAAPIQQTATSNDGNGGSITAQYSVTDNGQTASISINCSASITNYNNSVLESPTSPGTSFYLNAASYYTATVSERGSGEADIYLIGDYIDVSSPYDQNSSNTYSGVVDPGSIDFNELFDFPNGYEYNNLSGSDSISVTFTAIAPIPEPSSAMLIGLPALALLARPPRPARRRIACRGTRKRWMSPSHLAEKE